MGLLNLWQKKNSQEFLPEDQQGHIDYVKSVTTEDNDSSKKANYQSTYLSDSASDTSGVKPSLVIDPEDSSGSKAYNHIFKDPEAAAYWQNLYEETKYESRHLVDPELTWTPEEERKVVWKSDFHACFWAFIMFLALDIDRYNLKNATADNLLEDLNMTQSDYNLGNTINLVCFLGAELPSQLVSKAVGADWFLPTQVTIWSLVAICQCRMKDRAGFLATRALVGFFEGGFLPEQITWLSYFYTHDEFVKRSAWFYVANPLTQMFSGLLAAAIQNLDGTMGWSGWRFVFLIEGLVTLAIGLASYKMPAGPANTRTWYRKKGWYTDREEKIMANRIVRDDPSKGTMNNRTGVSFKMLWRAFSDYDMWLLYLSRFAIDIIATPLSNYVSIILTKELGFTTIKTNLLMVPYNFVQIFTMLGQSHIATRLKQNGFSLFFSPFWLLVPIVCMRAWPGFIENHWGSYALIFVALAYPPSWPITISWSSANSFSVSRRTVSSAIMNMFSQAGSIVGSNIFQPTDAPKYKRGLESLIGISAAACVLCILTRYYYILRNKQRDKKWDKMTVEEQVEYIKTTTDEGNKRLDSRFTY